MAINITDELTAKTKKGKIASAKEVFLEGDQENLQQVGDKTHQLEEAIKSISVTGGASTASAVSYDNTASGMTAVTAQAALDEIAAKDKAQDAVINTKAVKTEVQASVSELKAKDAAQDVEIAKKANTADVSSKMQEEQTRVDAELDKKLDKESVVQEFGDAEDKVVSQAKLPFREIENPEFIHCVVDAEDHLLFGIQMDGSVEWGKGIPAPVREKLEEIVEQAKENTDALSERVEEVNKTLTESIAIVNTELLEKIQSINDKDNRFHAVVLNGKKISILGDSLSTYNGYIPEGNGTYYPNPDYDVTSVDKTWWYSLIQEVGGILEVNESSSGSKISGKNSTRSFIQRSSNLGDPDYIIIHGGTNDSWTQVPVGTLHFDNKEEDLNIEEFADAYDLMVRKLLALYPHANIVAVIPNVVSADYTNVIASIVHHYNLLGVVDLRKYGVSAGGHYNSEEMALVKNAIVETLFINKNMEKVRGKDLVDEEIVSSYKLIENEEWLHAVVDSEEHILFGIYRETGKPYFPLNEMYHVEQNPEFFAAWIDEEDHLLMGIRRDGQIVGEINAVTALKEVVESLQGEVDSLKESTGTLDKNLQELIDVFSFVENPEFLSVETDSEGKMLASTKEDGSHYAYKMQSETIDAKVDKEEGKSLIDATVAEVQTTIEDVEERMQITTDAEDKILSYRDKDGVQHEHSMDVEKLKVARIELEDEGVNDLQIALVKNGFRTTTPMDWSESSFIQIPEPRFAIINITGIDSMPTTKTQNKKAYLEFWDMQGNYFKKHAILNAQGNSSLTYIKKNATIDLCDDEWVGDSTPKIRIGEWVPQDSFHLKAYYTDFFRGVSVACYKIYDQILCTRGILEDRLWKKYLLNENITNYLTKSLGTPCAEDTSLLFDTGARCVPDGFPVACYLNGEFYGVFSWQLKKHRDNYHMDKSTTEHIHLDGRLGVNTIFSGKDNINWTKFEVRNPKNLYTKKGKKYEDVQVEIAGEEEINSWIASGELPDGTVITSKIKKNLQATAKVKKFIQNFADSIFIIKAAEDTYNASDKTNEDLQAFKSVFEKYYDKDNLIDYVIFSDIVCNGDGFEMNWQWLTYTGEKWGIGAYDCDMTFGGSNSGTTIYDVLYSHVNHFTGIPTEFILKYYTDELQERYRELADEGILSIENIFSQLLDWTLRIGTDFYKEEYKRWPDSPCIGNSEVRTEYWELILDESGIPQTDTLETFDATVQYNIGDIVSFGKYWTMGFYKFKCIKETVALESNTPHAISMYSPIQKFKHSDSIYRLQKWIMKNIINMDKLYKYTRN